MAVRVCRPFNPARNGIQACESTAFPPEANTNVLGETLDDADEILRPGMEIAPPSTVPPQFGREPAGRFWGSATNVHISLADRRRSLAGSTGRGAANVTAVSCG